MAAQCGPGLTVHIDGVVFEVALSLVDEMPAMAYVMRDSGPMALLRFQVELDGRIHRFRPIVVGMDGPAFDTVVAALELIPTQQWQNTLGAALATLQVELAASRDRALESAADWDRRLHHAQTQSAALACPDLELRGVLLRLAPTWKGTAAEMWATGRAIVGPPPTAEPIQGGAD